MRARHILPWATFGGLLLAGGAIAGPIPDASAHSSAAAFTSATCLDNGVWAATLHISGTDLSKQPQATIVNPQAPLKVAVPYTHSFTTNGDTFTVSITVDWNDGFHQDLGSFTANRPTGCVPATTTTTEVTTSTTTVPSSTSVPPTSTASSVPPATSATTSPSQSPPSSEASSTKHSQPTGPTSTAQRSLPATGSSNTNVAVGGVGALLIGGVLLCAVRRRSVP